MSAKFWAAHSIKGQTPDHPDSLIAKLRSGRRDVSGMGINELHQHMEGEAALRQRIRVAQGQPEILPTPSDYESYNRTMAARNTVIPTAPRDATKIRPVSADISQGVGGSITVPPPLR